MKQSIVKFALIGALTLPYNALAAEPMELVIVTAARMPQTSGETLVDTTVLDEREIRESGAADVPALLRILAGVEVYQSGGVGKQSSTFMRGTNSSHVLVLLDGVRINSATTGTTALEHIMLDNVERIEVVRGNVSSLYGSEAIGGVIQIFTKRGRGEPSFNVSAGIQSHNTQRLAAGFGGEAGDTAFNLQASKFQTDGISAIETRIVPAANPDDDGYDNTSVSGSVSHRLDDDNSLSATVYQSRGDVQYDNAFGASTDLDTTKVALSKIALVSENRFGDAWHSKVELAQGADESKSYLNGTQTSAIKTENLQIGWQNTLSVSTSGKLLLGFENLSQLVTSTTQYTESSRKINSAYAGYTGYIGAHQVQANVRQDRYSDFGAANTWSLGVGHALGEAWRASIRTSTAFKAPTFNDMYGPAAWGSNPGLNPERSRNNEVGLHYAAGGQNVDVVYFDNHIRDLIVYQWPAGMVNLDEARSNGVEVSYAGEFGATGIKAAVTSQNPRDAKTRLVLLRRAKTFANLGIMQQLGALKVGGVWQYSGKREDIDINTFARTTLDAYSVVNLTANYALSQQLDLVLRADNLFDKEYMLAHGYNTLGRTFFVGLNYQQ